LSAWCGSDAGFILSNGLNYFHHCIESGKETGIFGIDKISIPLSSKTRELNNRRVGIVALQI